MSSRWIVVVALLAAACNKSEETTSPAAAERSAAKSDSKVDPNIEAKIAGDLAVQKALLVQKEEVLHNLSGRFDEVSQRIDAMREKFEKSGPEVRENAASLLTDVRTRQATMRNELEKLKSVPADRWKESAGSFEKSLKDLEESTESLMMKVK